jgi:hypothetical protein
MELPITEKKLRIILNPTADILFVAKKITRKNVINT